SEVAAEGRRVRQGAALGAEMIKNRSVPSDTVLPHIVCRNVVEMIEWLAKTLGFTEHYRYGDPSAPSGAQVYLGSACIMLRNALPGGAAPDFTGSRMQSLTVFVEDVDAHYQRAKSAGANIVEELNETFYGERQYGVEDPEGGHWLISQH